MRVVIPSQVYVPDPASVGQHLHEFAAEMARRGHDVRVFCSARGYDDPTRRYPRSEWRAGVTIKRYALPIFSKSSFALRVLGSAWAQLTLFLRALTTPSDVLFFSTSPPLVGVAATVAAKLRGLLGRRPRLVFWAMDLNPDQLVAMKKLRKGSIAHCLLEAANRFVLQNADLTIALDRFMEERLRRDGRSPRRIVVLPPWPHEDASLPSPPRLPNLFRAKHGLGDRFVVMYSGNHSPANPLDTLLEATKAFAGDDSIRFVFVGGGLGKRAIDAFIAEHRPMNMVSLPYQPLETLRESLAAADVHVVSLGDDLVGIVHPSKVYGAMAVGRPVLFFGPTPSHVGDLLDRAPFGRVVPHGDAATAARAIGELLSLDEARRREVGEAGRRLLLQSMTRDALRDELCDAVQSATR